MTKNGAKAQWLYN